MRSVVSGITYLLVACSVILLILIVFVSFKEQVFDKIPTNESIKKTEKATDETDDSDDMPSEDNTGPGYAVPTGNINVQPDEAVIYAGKLELPVSGATGYASVRIDVLDDDYNVLANLEPGKGFRILQEDGQWWRIYVNSETDNGVIVGWVRHNLCMINLPDVIPSIIYNNTNAYGSVFRANEEIIPDITGKQLYAYSPRKDGKAYNERLGKDEYIVPVLYAMAETIYKAQLNALENGDSLMIYEGFRPYETQQQVYNEVINLPYEQKNFGSYGIQWFIMSGVGNHQMGYAIDTSLAKIVEEDYAVTGKYKYKQFKYVEYTMPCNIHELSVKATLKNAEDNIPAQNLQKYCANAGLSNLQSEWWHFNDENTNAGITKKSDGKYIITECLSASPGN
ncbi:MAG: D-alanyl-D-alanine carboxypeptidase family protein [Oscillospiraceae bacterium]|nr:D-alanyl-D-alanine carboxypeptidase family protein [Oscillospiraceae bacterium]